MHQVGFLYSLVLFRVIRFIPCNPCIDFSLEDRDFSVILTKIRSMIQLVQ